MKFQYSNGGRDRALEAIVQIVDHFCGPEEIENYDDHDRLQHALRRMCEYAIYVDDLVENHFDEYEERLVTAIEKICDILENQE